jgi:hypothetical protein
MIKKQHIFVSLQTGKVIQIMHSLCQTQAMQDMACRLNECLALCDAAKGASIDDCLEFS